MKRRTGFTLVELLAVLAAGIVVIVLVAVFVARARRDARFRSCNANLKFIGSGLATYSQAYKDQWPWEVSANQWDTPTGAGRFLPPTQGTGYNVTGLLFMLVRNGGGEGGYPYICPSTGDVGDPNTKGPGGSYNWDFCPYKDPYPYGPRKGSKAEHVSYSYQAPMRDANGVWSSGVTANSKAGLVVMADRTPAYDGLNAQFNWANPGQSDPWTGISQNHKEGRINLLYADFHVGDSGGRADVGLNNDNIYSCADTDANTLLPATQQGPGSLNLSNHRSPADSFLIGPTKMDK